MHVAASLALVNWTEIPYVNIHLSHLKAILQNPKAKIK